MSQGLVPGLPAGVIDARLCWADWERWQQGGCGAYALALVGLDPALRLGATGFRGRDGAFRPDHFFAHDDSYAYDSHGQHHLPFYGVDRDFAEVVMGTSADRWALSEPEPEVAAARQHALENGILEGRYGTARRGGDR